MSDTLVPAASRPRTHAPPAGTSFVGLVGIELRRLWWRRLTKVAVVAVAAFIALATVQVYQQTNPENIAARVDDYNRVVAEMKSQYAAMPAEEKAAQLASCKSAEAEQVQGGSDPGDFGCDQMFQPPTPENFGLVNPARGELIRGVAQAGLYLLGFLAFLLGASFVAAEFTSGSMGNWLTFQPRRLRVATAKLLAATTGGVAIGAVGVGLATLGVTLVTTINRPDATLKLPDAAELEGGSVAQTLVRVVAAVALGGLGGAVLALILRSTAAVIGFVIGYGIIFEGYIANAFDGGRLRPWFAGINIDAFVQNGAKYFVETCTDNGCQGTQATNSYTHGWVYLLIIAVVGVVIALLSFRRRDVS